MDDYIFLEKLPLNCKSSHIFKLQNEENVLPIKLYMENNFKRWNLQLYNGVCILYISSLSKILIIHVDELNTNRTRTMTINNQYKNLLVNINEKEIYNKLTYYFKQYSINLNDVLNNTKYNVITREEILATRKNTNELEANGHDEIISLLGNNNFLETPEKCRSDAGYFLNDNNKCIGIQIKTATVRKTGEMNIFHNTNNYDGLVLFCRPMTRLYIGTLVIPASLINVSSIGIPLYIDNSIYSDYLVPDTKLNDFMKKLYNAVINGNQNLTWPLGKNIDISSINIYDFKDLCIPQYKTNLIEYKMNLWRKEKFPNFNYQIPRIQGSTIDTIINGINVQDKVASKRKDCDHSYKINLKKNNGRNMGNKNLCPYETGDFDCIFVFLNDTYKYIFIIPIKDLILHEFVTSNNIIGKKGLILYTLDFIKKTKRLKNSNIWTQKFCINIENDDAEEKIRNILNTCK